MTAALRMKPFNDQQRQRLFSFRQQGLKFLVLSAQLLFFFFAGAQPRNAANNLGLILGTWMSVDDAKNQIVFTKTAKLDYYDKERVSTYSYTITGDSLTTTDKSDGSIYRYAILSLTKNYLTLMYLDRGNLLKFRRNLRKK